MLIQKWKPWENSTGAKTVKGKNVSKMNAYKHGARCARVRNLAIKFNNLKKELSFYGI